MTQMLFSSKLDRFILPPGGPLRWGRCNKENRMMPARWREIAIGVLFCAPALCFGWGRDGHRIAAEIASRHLEPKAQAFVQVLLAGQSLADVSTWADEIKNTRRATAPWHYADMDLGEKEFSPAGDCPAKGCVVSAILRYSAVLRDGRASIAERTEALKFLVHFVGDVHCLMHVAYAHDNGGNDVAVEFFFNRTNLHKVWDSLLIERQKKYWKDYARQLDEGLAPEMIKRWSGSSDPAQWATDTHRLAVQAYDIPKDGQLGQTYFVQALPTLNQQLSAAGIRLAKMLNAAFDEWREIPATLPADYQGTSKAVQFVGSRRSKVYHYPGCELVRSISPQNLVEYYVAPASKRLHQGCTR